MSVVHRRRFAKLDSGTTGAKEGMRPAHPTRTMPTWAVAPGTTACARCYEKGRMSKRTTTAEVAAWAQAVGNKLGVLVEFLKEEGEEEDSLLLHRPSFPAVETSVPASLRVLQSAPSTTSPRSSQASCRATELSAGTSTNQNVWSGKSTGEKNQEGARCPGAEDIPKSRHTREPSVWNKSSADLHR